MGLNRWWGLIIFQRFLSEGLLEEGARKRLGLNRESTIILNGSGLPARIRVR